MMFFIAFPFLTVLTPQTLFLSFLLINNFRALSAFFFCSGIRGQKPDPDQGKTQDPKPWLRVTKVSEFVLHHIRCRFSALTRCLWLLLSFGSSTSCDHVSEPVIESVCQSPSQKLMSKGDLQVCQAFKNRIKQSASSNITPTQGYKRCDVNFQCLWAMFMSGCCFFCFLTQGISKTYHAGKAGAVVNKSMSQLHSMTFSQLSTNDKKKQEMF